MDFEYGDDDPWPAFADGAGGTLALIDVNSTPPGQYGNPARWTAGPATPGKANSIEGDLNGDGEITADDIDFLCAGIRRGDTYFDLNGDGQLGRADLDFFVQDVLHTTIGDANVDGVFNSTDFVIVFQVGEYEDGIAGNSTWGDGDWTCDGDFTSSDLVAALQAGGYVAEAGLPAVSSEQAARSEVPCLTCSPPLPLAGEGRGEGLRTSGTSAPAPDPPLPMRSCSLTPPSLWEGREASVSEHSRGGLFGQKDVDHRAGPPRRLVPRLRPSQREGEVHKRLLFAYSKTARPPMGESGQERQTS